MKGSISPSGGAPAQRGSAASCLWEQHGMVVMSKVIMDQIVTLRKKDRADAIAPLALEWSIYSGCIGGIAAMMAQSFFWAQVLMCAMLGCTSGLLSLSIVAAVMGSYYETRLTISEPELERLSLKEGL